MRWSCLIHRVVFSPVVTLQCSMADPVAHWIRDDVEPTLKSLGLSLRGVETLESFGCRTFNGISGAKLSEHGHANALDVHSIKMANGIVMNSQMLRSANPYANVCGRRLALAFRQYLATEQMRIMKTMSISI